MVRKTIFAFSLLSCLNGAAQVVGGYNISTKPYPSGEYAPKHGVTMLYEYPLLSGLAGKVTASSGLIFTGLKSKSYLTTQTGQRGDQYFTKYYQLGIPLILSGHVYFGDLSFMAGGYVGFVPIRRVNIPQFNFSIGAGGDIGITGGVRYADGKSAIGVSYSHSFSRNFPCKFVTLHYVTGRKE